MSELLVDTARQIKEFATKGAHPSRIICYDQLSFRARGDKVGESTRLIGVSPLRYNPDGLHIEEIGYMAGGIGSPWLKPVILPVGAEEVRLERKSIADPKTDKLTMANSIIGLPRGTWMGICIAVQEGLGGAYLEGQKSQYRNWLETGRQPIYGEDPTGDIVGAMVEAAWKPLSPEQEGVLESGLVALLRCLQEQPKDHILNLPIDTKGTAG